jgi:hypothetical protein
VTILKLVVRHYRESGSCALDAAYTYAGRAFVTHAVEALDKILLPLQASREELLPLVGRPCIAAHLLLRRQAATLQTVRSVGLIKDGILYCSSIFGNRDVPIRQLQPALPHPEPLLVLSTDQTLLIGSPILIQWYPLPRSAEDGCLAPRQAGLGGEIICYVA